MARRFIKPVWTSTRGRVERSRRSRSRRAVWLVIRVVTERDFTYRMATTAPFYFEFDSRPRVSRKAAEFFQQWLAQTEQQVASEPEQARSAAQPYIDAAKRFWAEKVKQATAP